MTIGDGTSLDMAGHNLDAITLSNEGTLKLINTETVTITNRDYDSGTIEYYGTGTYNNMVADPGYHYHNLSFTGFGSDWTLPQALDVEGVLTIASGVTFNANAKNITLCDGWDNSGTFNHGGGTVIFDGATAGGVYGDTTFYNLSIEVPGKIMYFEGDAYQEVLNVVTFKGDVNNKLYLLREEGTTGYWHIMLPAFRASNVVEYVHVENSYNDREMYLNPPNSDGSNTAFWFTPSNNPDPKYDWRDPIIIIPTFAFAEMRISLVNNLWGEEEEKAKWGKKYAKGKYKTVVVVFEGSVALAEYDEMGPEYKNATMVKGGEKFEKEAEIGGDNGESSNGN